MNDLLNFDFETSHVRVVMIAGAPWWVAADVAAVLRFTHTPHMTRMLDDDEKGVHIVDPLYSTNTPKGGEQEVTVISESGLFAVILRSRRPEAKRFRRWVTGEVLPQIRRTGRYAPADEPDPPLLPSPALDDAELPRLNAAIGIMREARHVWGREECRRIWVRIGLPTPIADAAEGGAGHADLAQRIAALTDGVDRVALNDLAAALSLKWDTRTGLMLGGVMRLLGWAPRKERVEGVPRNVWRRADRPLPLVEAR